jgi:hypothetical protein
MIESILCRAAARAEARNDHSDSCTTAIGHALRAPEQKMNTALRRAKNRACIVAKVLVN